MSARFCKVCFKRINPASFLTLYEDKALLCDECLQQIKRRFECRKIDGVKVFSLFAYQEPLVSWLLKYKENLDYELHDVFLYGYRTILNFVFHGYTIVPAPSTPKMLGFRGFSHIPEMCSCLSLEIVEGLTKTDGKDQKELHRNERLKVKERIKLNPEVDLHDKRILFVDDVSTTGATLCACLDLLKTVNPKSLVGFILMSNGLKDAKKGE